MREGMAADKTRLYPKLRQGTRHIGGMWRETSLEPEHLQDRTPRVRNVGECVPCVREVLDDHENCRGRNQEFNGAQTWRASRLTDTKDLVNWWYRSQKLVLDAVMINDWWHTHVATNDECAHKDQAY